MMKFDDIKLVTNIKDLKGKTIASTFCELYQNPKGFVFTDGTVAIIETSLDYDGDIELGLEKNIDHWEACSYGLISEEERDMIKDRINKKYEKQRLEEERKQYEKLKAKFEGK
jgi:hypothetical protein